MDKSFRYHERHFFSYSHVISTDMPNPHFHDTYEIYYLIDGCRRYLIKNIIFDATPGDLILIPALTIHRTLCIPNKPKNEYHSRYLLCPKADMIPDVFLPLFENYHWHIPEQEQAAVKECFQNIANNCQKEDMYSIHDNQANLIHLLTIVARNHITHTTNTSESNKTIHNAAKYIKENCHLPLSLSSVSEIYGFSKEYFSTLFKATIGFGFNDYLNQMRISKACTLLLSSTLPISEISIICGFNDSNYFANVFKRTLGITPSQYRIHKKIC